MEISDDKKDIVLIPMNLYERIEVLLKNQNINKEQLCNLIGISEKTLFSWKDNSPDIKHIINAAAILQTTIDYLLTGKEVYCGNISNKKFLAQYNSLSITDQNYIKNMVEALIHCNHYMNELP